MLKLVKCSPLYGANRSCSFQSLSTHVLLLRTCLIFHYFFLIKQTNYFFSILTLMVYIYIQLYFSYKKKKEEPIEIRERERERERVMLIADTFTAQTNLTKFQISVLLCANKI